MRQAALVPNAPGGAWRSADALALWSAFAVATK